jgi:hypothetical protein
MDRFWKDFMETPFAVGVRTLSCASTTGLDPFRQYAIHVFSPLQPCAIEIALSLRQIKPALRAMRSEESPNGAHSSAATPT